MFYRDEISDCEGDIISIFIQPFKKPSCSESGGGVMLEETPPIMIEMFHHKIKVIGQKNIVVNCSGA